MVWRSKTGADCKIVQESEALWKEPKSRQSVQRGCVLQEAILSRKAAEEKVGGRAHEESCIVCLGGPREIVFLHCGHMVCPANGHSAIERNSVLFMMAC